MLKRQIIFIAIFSFIISLFFQWMRWGTLDFTDAYMWANQAEYFQTNDSRQFDALLAYGHPGGTIIEGTIAIHEIFNISYNNSLVIFITIFNSLIIAGISVLCFLLRRNYLWWITILSTLSISVMYAFSTPPSAIVSPLIVFLCLLTLYFYENKEKIKIPQILFFAFISGLAVATRADIGIFSTLVFLIFLLYKKIIDWKKLFVTIFSSIFFFILFDPFMHFMPLQHIKDLISKIVFHYAEYNPTHMTFFNVLDISFLSFVGIFLSVFLLFMRKKIKLMLPTNFILMLFLITISLYTIFLTSHYQAARYFQPIIFIWEVFLPLLIFNLTSNISFKFLNTAGKNEVGRKIVNIFFVVILVGFQVYLFYL